MDYNEEKYTCITTLEGQDCTFYENGVTVLPKITAGDLLITFFLFLIFMLLLTVNILKTAPNITAFKTRYSATKGKVVESEI